MAQLFNIHSLPFGICSYKGQYFACLAYGEWVVPLHDLVQQHPEWSIHPDTTRQPYLNKLIAHGNEPLQKLWEWVQDQLQQDGLREIFLPASQVTIHLPLDIGDYTDFYASEYHASRVGTIFRGKDAALMLNWKSLPVGYHGRSSSIGISGEPVIRPKGQYLEEDKVVFGRSRKLDFELELAAVIGKGNARGETISVHDADEHIFGYVLLNDWSARDIQSWEYRPLGPFLGKNFATTISPWITPAFALKHRSPMPKQHPEVLDYLKGSADYLLDIDLEVILRRKDSDICLTKSNSKYLYWSFQQMVAHHTIGGCNLRPGDLLASGTISGPAQKAAGCLLEITENGSKPFRFDDDEITYLLDGDEIILKGTSQNGETHVVLGEIANKIT